jgi:hypothetical protein
MDSFSAKFAAIGGERKRRSERWSDTAGKAAKWACGPQKRRSVSSSWKLLLAAGEIAICPLPIDFFFFSRYSVNKSASRFIDDPSPAGQTESSKFRIQFTDDFKLLNERLNSTT